MLKLTAIGNLGADAQFTQKGENCYITFRIAHNKKTKSPSGTIMSEVLWITAFYKNSNQNLLNFLKKGTKVYIKGDVDFHIFDSAKKKAKDIGITVFVQDLELCQVQVQTTEQKKPDIF